MSAHPAVNVIGVFGGVSTVYVRTLRTGVGRPLGVAVELVAAGVLSEVDLGKMLVPSERTITSLPGAEDAVDVGDELPVRRPRAVVVAGGRIE